MPNEPGKDIRSTGKRSIGKMGSSPQQTPSLTNEQRHDFMRQFHGVWDVAQQLWPDDYPDVLCQAFRQEDPLGYIESKVTESTTAVST